VVVDIKVITIPGGVLRAVREKGSRTDSVAEADLRGVRPMKTKGGGLTALLQSQRVAAVEIAHDCVEWLLMSRSSP
jgi:hypothetical protein